MTSVWITPDKQTFLQYQREDLSDMVQRINVAMGLPKAGVRELGIIRAATDGILRYRVEDSTYRAIVAASTGGLGLSATEIANATQTAPAGDASTTTMPANLFLDVEHGVLVKGDSITAGTSSGFSSPADLWTGNLFNYPFVGQPGDPGASGPSTGFSHTWMDRKYERQVYSFAFPSAQLYNVNPVTSASSGLPANTTFTADAATDVLTLANNSANVLGASNGTWVVFTTTGTLPAPLAEGTDYYLGQVSGNTTNATAKVYPTIRDAMENTNAINITTAGTGTHTITAPNPCWWRMMDRYLNNLRGPENKLLTVVVFVGTNSIAYNGSQAVTGAGSIVEAQLVPYMTKLRSKLRTGDTVLFVTPIVRSSTSGLNNRLAEFRDYIIANRVALGIDKVYDPGTHQVFGKNVFALTSLETNYTIRAAAADVNTTTNTITRNAAGDTLWDSTWNGQPMRCSPGASGALPAPLDANTVYFIGSITATTFKLYPTRTDALAGTNEIDLTTQGTVAGGSASQMHGFRLAYIATDSVHPWVYGQVELGKAIKTALNDMLYNQ